MRSLVVCCALLLGACVSQPEPRELRVSERGLASRLAITMPEAELGGASGVASQ